MLYLIGGTPRSGKSTLAKRLVERNNIAFLSTDFLIHMINETVPDIHFIEPYAEIPNKFYPYLKNLLKHVEDSVRDYTIEGDAFLPSHVFEWQKIYKMKACFLGFSKITLQEIKDNVGENDWLDDLSNTDRENLPDWIMKTSSALKEECQKYHIQYFDMADGPYNQNLEKAYHYFFCR